MTREELHRALDMRIDGRGYEDIAMRMNYHYTTVYSALHNVIGLRRTNGYTVDDIVYPELRKYMQKNDMTIRMLYVQAFCTNRTPPQSFYRQIFGKAEVSYTTQSRLEALTGIPHAVLFRRDHE